MKALDYVLSSNEKKKKISDKEILRKVRIIVPAQGADVKPPLGPTLGQFGINIKDFCDKFNARTKNFDEDVLLNVELTLFSNKSYVFIVKTSPIFFLVNEENFHEDSSSYSDYVFLSSFYKIVHLKSLFYNDISQQSISHCILSTLRASNLIFINDIFIDIK